MAGILNLLAGVLDEPSLASSAAPPRQLLPGQGVLNDNAVLNQSPQNATNRRDISPLSVKPSNDVDPFWRGVSRFFSAKTPLGGLSRVIEGVREDRANDGGSNEYDLERRKREVELQALQQKIMDGSIVEVGTNSGVFYDRNTGRVIQPPPGAIEALKQVTEASTRPNMRGGGNGGPGISEYAETVVDPVSGAMYKSGLSNGLPVVFDFQGNKVTDPAVLMRLQSGTMANTSFRSDVKQVQDQNNMIAENARLGQRTITQIDALRQGYRGAQGTGVSGATARFLSENLGIDFAGINLADKQQFETAVKGMEADLTRQLLGGQGQITEGERKIIREMLPQLSTDPRAFDRIIGVYENIAKANVAASGAWDAYAGRLEEAGKTPSARVFNNRLLAARMKNTDAAWAEFNTWAATGEGTPSSVSPKTDKVAPPANQPAPQGPGGVQTTPSGRKWSIPGQSSQGSTTLPLGVLGGSVTVTPSGPQGGPLLDSMSSATPPRPQPREMWAVRDQEADVPNAAPVVRAEANGRGAPSEAEQRARIRTMLLDAAKRSPEWASIVADRAKFKREIDRIMREENKKK